jgi:GNAT superfamily N-acetyltransferase
VPETHPLDAITRECFRSFAVFPNAAVIDNGEVFGVITDKPITFFNGIAMAHFPDGDLDAGVLRATAPFRARNRAFRWWVAPWTEPPGLPAALRAHGMRHMSDSEGMTADLGNLPDTPMPQGLTIRRIRNAEELVPWAGIIVTVFERPMSEAGIWIRAFSTFGFGNDSPWAQFIGFLDGVPVATTAVMTVGKLAGIYHVATLPSARGRGIGAALTRAGLDHARELGAIEGVLQAAPMAEGVYRSIGFRDRGTLSMYDWRPEYGALT